MLLHIKCKGSHVLIKLQVAYTEAGGEYQKKGKNYGQGFFPSFWGKIEMRL